MGIFEKLSEGLKKTRLTIADRMDNIVKYYTQLDDDFYEEIEDVLIASDIGVDTSGKIISKLKDEVKEKKIGRTQEVKEILRNIIKELMETEPFEVKSPLVILMVGVNGAGKTTSAGKLAALYKSQSLQVMMCAGDTFRAAAVEQLTTWAERADVPLTKTQTGADPSAVVFDAASSAKTRGIDVLICDTAGRLHNKANLMAELSKISRVVDKAFPEANRETLLVVDATTGQNAISQAKLFSKACDISGIILSKLDGTARGGVAVAVKELTGIPVRYIGVGENIDDLEIFDADAYARAII